MSVNLRLIMNCIVLIEGMHISVEEGSLMWVWLRSEEPGDPVCNLSAGLLEFLGIAWLGSVELSAVAAVVAV